MLFSVEYWLSAFILITCRTDLVCAGPAPRTPTWSPSRSVSRNPSRNSSSIATSRPSASGYSMSISNTSRIAPTAGTAVSPQWGIVTSMDQSAFDAEAATMASLGEHFNKAVICEVGHCASPNPTGATSTVDADVVEPMMIPDADLQADCVLWNSSCTGDKNAAALDFFTRVQPELDSSPCFMSLSAEPDCLKIESPERLKEMSEIKDWMRGDACGTAAASYKSSLHYGTAVLYEDENCCGSCQLVAGTVDVYYWPEANASTSCLDVIGTYVNPLTYGATIDTTGGWNYWSIPGPVSLTSSRETYWGCTVKDGGQLTYMQTAVMGHVDDIIYKEILVNPWSPPACVGSAAATPSPKNGASSQQAQIRARAHSLVQNSTNSNDGSPVTTAVLSGTTL